MTPTAPLTSAHVEQVMQDVACPACGYNLRGLYGPTVDCPECGHACDVARLIRLRWDKPWYRAPKFNSLVLPVAWAVLGGLGALLVTALTPMAFDLPLAPLIALGVWAVVLVGWVASFRPAYRVFDSIRGVGLALLAHGIFLIYLVTLMLVVSLGIGMIVAVVDGSYAAAIVPVVVIALACAAAYVARRAERWIAEQCIREYLRRMSLADDDTLQSSA